ncbi:sigma factor-like helix-turn-helix DNA-binding protein [Blastococcus sp. Marseille-P5729]|uniref:sigma factor-like helix-turn-helix DNA-binding protein n=1 Tax=Blastococcus sp. Marseille-P5729 TaxID=2086582 RepID=UPI000D0EF432|nr:sigma factor-like helix-turn-helix DNA-binding protein [Blastococcus sp. Marseille-P5729]
MVDPDFEFLDLRPRNWADAFPWLPGKASSEGGTKDAWWSSPIDDAELAARAALIGKVVELAIDHLGKWTIGEVFPGLAPDISLAMLDLPVRAKNVLNREQLLLTADLADVSLEELLAFRNAGIGTVRSILQQLAELSTSLPQASAPLQSSGGIETASPSNAWLGDLIRDLETLAEWNLSLGRADSGLLGELPLGAPPDAVAARKRLLALSAGEVLPSTDVNVADALEAAIYGLDQRYQKILRDRVFAWEPLTLEELGQEFGVTRERVRQVEVKARAKLDDLVTAANSVGRAADFVRTQIRGVRPLQELLDQAPALAHEVVSVGQPTWRVIDVLDDAYEIADGWCAEPSFEAARRDTSVFLDELADSYGVVRLADVSLSGDEAGSLPWLKEWLIYLGYEVRDQFVLLKTASLNDMAAAILSIEGAPLTFDELHKKVGRGAAGSLRNQVSTDPVFTKIDREHFALTEWGLEGYTNIRGEIGKLLEQADGELPLATVVESLVGRFGVSANSVAVYAGSPPYNVMNGIVRTETGQLAGGGRNPAKVQRYYRRGGDWLYRTTVTFDHLRGSGWPASTALSTILRMAPGEYAELSSRLGPQKFSYKTHQPSFGSIKRFLEDMDLGIGDEIFLVFKKDGSFDVEKLPDVPDVPDGRMAQALRLVGADISLDVADAIAALGSAIKFAPDADIVSIAHGYKARREQHIHDLILGLEPSSDE